MTSNKIENLFNELMRNPSAIERTENDIRNILETEEGYMGYKTLLINSNGLSYMYLPKVTAKPFYSEDFLNFLIDLHPPVNFIFYIKNYLDSLSKRNLIHTSFITNCINKNRYDLIDGVCMKYRELTRSNELFKEIKTNIELLTPSLNQFLSNGSDASTFLSIFYSCVYQDIHPYFEDNLNHFFETCYKTYNDQPDLILSIFELFITKYQELTNLEIIINTLCQNVPTGQNDLILSIITRAYSYRATNRPLVNQWVNKSLEMIEIDIDEHETTNCLNNSNERSGFNHLIKLINPSPSECTEKTLFYQMGVLGKSDQEVMSKATLIISGGVKSDIQIAFDAFYYCLTIKHIIPTSPEWLKTENIFISCKMMSEEIKLNANYHIKSLDLNIFTHNEAIQSTESINCNNNTEVLNLILTANKKYLDRYTSLLIFNMIKNGVINSDKYEFICNYIKSLFAKIELITDVGSRTILFDIYILLGIKCNQFDQELMQRIMKEEMVELYHLLFFYMAVNVKSVDKELILNILQQFAFYEEKTLHMSLSVLVIGALDVDYITRDQAIAVNNNYLKNETLGYKLNQLIDQNSCDELIYLATGKFNNTLLDNYLHKKWARAVIQKMKSDGISGDALMNCAIKNKKSIEYEYTLHSITLYFNL